MESSELWSGETGLAGVDRPTPGLKKKASGNLECVLPCVRCARYVRLCSQASLGGQFVSIQSTNS